MALDFLSNNNDKKVLVITTNALFKKGVYSEHGQFLKDWFEKLPFKSLDLESRIVVYNNHYSHFNHKAEYGLVIIDEAQLFLNNESMRYRALTENISTQKVVFLTATPIKNSKHDLQVYVDIAKKITGKDISNDWIECINAVDKQMEDIICNTFDVSAPVTRYFKDTIMSLNIEGYKKSQARRLLPHLWQYSQGNYRTHIHSSFYTYHISAKVYKTDFWTQCINYELWKMTFQDCTWRNLLELLEECENITLY